MERFKIENKNIEELKKGKEEAMENNPVCAAGGCGKMCGTKDCVKTWQGAINKLNNKNRELGQTE